MAARDGRIVWVGTEAALMEEVRLVRGGEMLDADGRVVMPGLVECHSHLAWAGDRADEFQMRVAGATYQQVQEAGGGIASTVHATRNATDDVLRALARKRLDRFMRYGVTTVEAKSGYGLSLEQETAAAGGVPGRLARPPGGRGADAAGGPCRCRWNTPTGPTTT